MALQKTFRSCDSNSFSRFPFFEREAHYQGHASCALPHQSLEGHTYTARIKLLDCTLTSWMDMIEFEWIMKIFPGLSSIGTIKNLFSSLGNQQL